MWLPDGLWTCILGDRRQSRDTDGSRRVDVDSGGANLDTYNTLSVLGNMEASGLFRQYMKGRHSGVSLFLSTMPISNVL